MLRSIVRHSRLLAVMVLLSLVGLQSAVSASPFGQGVFGADVPFGSDTSMSISLGGNVNLSLTPSGNEFTGSGSHTVTVTSTDVVGYRLYLYTPGSSAMSSGFDTIPASGNSSPAGLALDTWGYNTTGSTSDFIGATTSPTVIKDSTGPHKNGEGTAVTYGVRASSTKSAGDYSASVVYTAVSKSE